VYVAGRTAAPELAGSGRLAAGKGGAQDCPAIAPKIAAAVMTRRFKCPRWSIAKVRLLRYFPSRRDRMLDAMAT